ncbi:hypothetical protein ACTMTF_31410 [Nonomuraea sp. ZG12]|uniref:hypothetical protein n=1 Tax=Nonomuraea sp. ZG12 TaxID=3452207 RepID=UPI003F8C2924
MHLGTRFHLVAAAFVFLAVVTACSADDRPTLNEATKQLVSDGDELLASSDMTQLGTAKATERADQDRRTSCAPDEVQRFYRAEGNISGPPDFQSPATTVALLKGKLRFMGYAEVMDESDLEDEHLGVAVVRHATTRLTFMIAVRADPEPGIMIVGKTECYARGK